MADFVDPFADAAPAKPKQFVDPFGGGPLDADGNDLFERPGVVTRVKRAIFGQPDAIDLPEIRTSLGEQIRTRNLPAVKERLNRPDRLGLFETIGAAGPGTAFDDSAEGRAFRDLALTTGDNEVSAVILKHFPDARFLPQPNGQTIVKIKGREDTVLNRSGVSAQDLTGPILEGGAMLAAATPAGRAGKVAGAIGRSLTTGAAVGGVEAGREALLSKATGGAVPIDFRKVLKIGGMGASLELVAPPLLALVGSVMRTPSLFKNGRLTNRGASILKEAGVDPNGITPATIREHCTRPHSRVAEIAIAGQGAPARGGKCEGCVTTGPAGPASRRFRCRRWRSGRADRVVPGAVLGVFGPVAVMNAIPYREREYGCGHTHDRPELESDRVVEPEGQEAGKD